MSKPAPEPFVVHHYTENHNPTLKGNGFDGLVLGEDRTEAEEFVNWVNTALGLDRTPDLAQTAEVICKAVTQAQCIWEWDNVNDPPCHPSDENWSGCGSCFANRPILAVAFRVAAEQLNNPLLDQLANQLETPAASDAA
jgi:hypothetical protein